MFCPLCQAEYRNGVVKCSDCHVDLVSSADEAQSVSARLWKGDRQHVLDHVLAALDSQDIRSHFEELINTSPRISIFGISLTPGKSTFQYEVRVLRSDLDRARSALASLELESPWSDRVTFGQAMNSYQREWETYRARKTRLVIWIVAVFLGFPPFLTLVAFIDRKLFSSTSLVFPAAFVWGALYMFVGSRLRVFPCPRCGKNFLGGVFHDPADLLTRPKAFLGRECVHCGLRKFAESDEDINQVSSRVRMENAVISMPIGSALRIFLAGAAGTLIGLVIAFLSPTPRRASVLEPLAPETSSPVGYMFRLQHLLTGPYVMVPWFLVMVYLAISKRDQPKSSFYALLAGLALPSIVFHYVLHWI
jgi:hypothetical protein